MLYYSFNMKKQFATFVTICTFIVLTSVSMQKVEAQSILIGQADPSVNNSASTENLGQGNVFNSIDIVSIVLSAAALAVSAFTAYRTFLATFEGKVWLSNRVVLNHLDGIPSLGFVCFFENSGAKPGILDDLRAKVEIKGSATASDFYPMVMRPDYSIYRSYTEADWYQFSLIPLPANYRGEKHLLLKPKNDRFTASPGEMIVTLEVRWQGREEWISIEPQITFSLTDEAASKWNDSNSSAIQITSEDVMSKRS